MSNHEPINRSAKPRPAINMVVSTLPASGKVVEPVLVVIVKVTLAVSSFLSLEAVTVWVPPDRGLVGVHDQDPVLLAVVEPLKPLAKSKTMAEFAGPVPRKVGLVVLMVLLLSG